MPKGRQLSPGRRQYLELKRRYLDVLLLVRMGDFYETFDEDARTMARVLDIALTARDVGGGGRPWRASRTGRSSPISGA